MLIAGAKVTNQRHGRGLPVAFCITRASVKARVPGWSWEAGYAIYFKGKNQP